MSIWKLLFGRLTIEEQLELKLQYYDAWRHNGTNSL